MRGETLYEIRSVCDGLITYTSDIGPYSRGGYITPHQGFKAKKLLDSEAGAEMGKEVKRGRTESILPYETLKIIHCNKRWFKCVDCCTSYIQAPEMLSIHHLIPRQKGGLDTMSNTVLLCIKCHNEREVKAEGGKQNGGNL